MNPPSVTTDGDPQTGAFQPTDPNIPYVHDVGKNTAPDFDLQYRMDGSGVRSNSNPTPAGKYYARPYIKNDTTCNYVIDYSQNCETAFTKPKQKVALPWFSNSSVTSSDINKATSTTTVQYDGTWQVFDLYNATDNTLTGVTAGGRNGLQLAAGANQFQAKDVGTYTLTVYLADSGTNTEWVDAATNTATTRTVTLEIKKKEIAVTFDNATLTSWQLNQRTSVDVTATGVIAGENPQLHVYYTKDSGTPTDVDASAIVLNSTQFDVSVDLSTFTADSQYCIYVELAPNVTANNNYTISNTSPSTFPFFIMKATISSVTIQWQYTNFITGTVSTSDTGTQVDYNEQAYTFAVDSTALPAGVSVSYTGDQTATNVKAGGALYSVTATISADTGYQLAASVPLTYTATYQIKPMLFDLSTLQWADNPEYNVGLVWMYLKDVPAGTIKQATGGSIAPAYGTYSTTGWMTVNVPTQAQAGFQPQNSGTAVTGGSGYTAGYVLQCDANHAFKTWTGDAAAAGKDGITLMNNDTVAIVSHAWDIVPKQINTSTMDTDWADALSCEDTDGDEYTVPLANVKGDSSPYKDVLEVKYYSDPSCTTEVTDIEHGIAVTPGQIEYYYAKLTVKSEHATNYKLFDTVFGVTCTEIVKEFTVGDNRTGVTVDFGPNKYVYNGEPQGQAPTINMQGTLSYTITKINSDGTETPVTGFPTDAGRYCVKVEFDNSDGLDVALAFRLTPSRFFFDIEKLTLQTDPWTTGTGNEAATEHVTADGSPYLGGTDYTSLYDYEVFEVINGVRQNTATNKDDLLFDTDYVAVLTVKSEFAKNVEFGADAQFEFPFRTGFDPNNLQIELKTPEYDNKLPYRGKEQTFEIKNWESIKRHIAKITRDDGVTGEDAFKVTGRKTYRITLELRKDENVFWEGGSYEDFVIEFEVVTREIERPNLPAVKFNGSAIDIMQYLPADYADWVKVEVYSYTANVDGMVGEKDEDENYIILHAGSYSVRFILLDTENTAWKPEGGNENVGYRIALLDVDSDPNVINVTLEVQKAQINGAWEDGVFKPENEGDEGKYTIKYIDEEGNEVQEGEFKDGVTYYAVATLNGEYMNDFEFAEDLRYEGNPAMARTEFTSTASFGEKALVWVKQYW
ncbi:MAG: hypothetical protein K2N74_01750, partial [Clostridiales bacterium]|nr:hypothetical protein [Clostridiales bacterium]